MSDVWVVRCPNGKVIGASTFTECAIKEAQSGTIKMDSRKALNETWNRFWDDGGEAGTYSCDGFALTRETLLTPAHAAVIEAAKAWEEVEILAYHMKEKQNAEGALVRAVDTLHALEGDA
jgi:hypothetical protein